MNRYVFDIETDGLLDDVTKVHCLALKNIDTGEITGYTGNGVWSEAVPNLKRLNLLLDTTSSSMTFQCYRS